MYTISSALISLLLVLIDMLPMQSSPSSTTRHATSGALVSTTFIRVPQDQPGIHAAIASAQNGDTVLVSPGTYHERIDFLGKDIPVSSPLLTTGAGKYITQTVIQPDS